MTTRDFNDRFWAVEAVIDTRELDTERKPIPGTGERHTCELCGKDHEVWAMLRHRRNNDRVITGTSCARKLNHLSDRNTLGRDWTTTRANGIGYYEQVRSKFEKVVGV